MCIFPTVFDEHFFSYVILSLWKCSFLISSQVPLSSSWWWWTIFVFMCQNTLFVKRNFYFMCMNILCACMYEYHECAWCPREPEEGVGSLVTGTKPQSSIRVSAHNSWAFSPSPLNIFLCPCFENNPATYIIPLAFWRLCKQRQMARGYTPALLEQHQVTTPLAEERSGVDMPCLPGQLYHFRRSVNAVVARCRDAAACHSRTWFTLSSLAFVTVGCPCPQQALLGTK